MQRFFPVCVALLLAVPAQGRRLFTGGRLAAAAKSSGHPVDDVIGMLQGLMGDAKKEGEKEEYSFTKFSHWCKTTDKTLNAAISEGKEKIDELSDVISAKEEIILALTTQISDITKQLLNLEKDNEEASALRKKEEKLYERTRVSVTETISGIETALKLLEAEQVDSLVQAKAKVRALIEFVQTVATAEQKGILREFAGEDPEKKERPEFKAEGDRNDHVKKYAFKSAGVIELLKQLEQRFDADLVDLTKAETNAVNAFNLANAARADEVKAAEKARETKASEKSDAEGEKASAEKELGSTQTNLQTDSDDLEDATKQCEAKAAEWEERQKIRSQELEAMQAAIKILGKVTGVRTSAPENPVPPPSPIDGASSFLQVRSSADSPTRALELIRAAAREVKSQALERFAQELSAHLTGPFDEVNGMIEKMIFHLMSEQKDEDDHKNWCDLELEKTDASIADKLDKMEELQMKIEAAKNKAAELTMEIVEDKEMVAKIDMHMKESKEIREVGKKENALAIKDAQAAQKAIADAIAVLETHYKETGMIKKESYELLQRQGELPPSPSTWDASYTGVTDPNQEDVGIVSVLRKVNEDFARMEADTNVQEERDEQTYKEEMSASEIEKATRLKDSEVKGEEKKRQVEKMAALTAQKKHVSDEHEATEQYLSDLQKACVDGTSTYEKRKEARAKEIDALHEAKDILKEAFEEKSDVSLLHKGRP